MDEQAIDVIWETKLDGRWIIRVTRDGEYKAILRIYDEQQHEVYSRKVGLLFGALFGPDIDDIASWKKIAIDWVDAQGS